MAHQSTRARLHQSGGSKPMHELLSAGRQWEALRARYWAERGRHLLSQECLGRQRHFERELDDLLAEMT